MWRAQTNSSLGAHDHLNPPLQTSVRDSVEVKRHPARRGRRLLPPVSSLCQATDIVVSVRGIGNKKRIRVLYFNEVSARYPILVSVSVHP